MNYSTTKANGNIKYYSESQLQDLDYEGSLPNHSSEFHHYGYLAKNIHIFSGETFHFFAKQAPGYVYLGSGDIKPETLGLPKIPEKFSSSFFSYLGYNLMHDQEKDMAIYRSDAGMIQDITQYVIDYYDIHQLVLHDEFEAGRANNDSEPSFDMSKYVVTTPGNVLDKHSLPYVITLPEHNRRLTITQHLLKIEPLS